MAARYKRSIKNYFIKKDYQGRFALVIFAAAILSCLLLLSLLAFFSADTMTISYSNNDLQFGRTPWMLFKSAAAANWLFLLIGGTLMVLAAIVGTHRIAGPLCRLERSLTSMAEGDLTDTLSLREKDEGKELAKKINDFNKTLSTKLSEIDRNAEAINNLLSQYENLNPAHISPEDATSICKAIRNHNDKLRSQLEFFALRND